MLEFARLRPCPRWFTAFIVVVAIGSLEARIASSASAQGPRRYELVSPADKNGGDVMPYSPRTRASSDGDTVGFASLVGFGDPHGSGIAVEYLAERMAGLGRWVTHALTPPVPNGSLNVRAAAGDTFFDGDFSADFERAVLFSPGRVQGVTGDDNVADVANLYVRDDLRTAGPGRYEVVTGCPACDGGAPLPAISSVPAILQAYLPKFVGATADMTHIVFSSIQPLTTDTPAQSPFCGPENAFLPTPSKAFCVAHLYEWHNGQVQLVGVLPNGTPADASFAGIANPSNSLTYVPHAVSDGRDGHVRIVFVQPTDDTGLTVSQHPDLLGVFTLANSQAGNVFLRADGGQTIQLNESERDPRNADAFAPAQYLDASEDGTRIFFASNQALTDDAQPGTRGLYMYDASKPASASDNLTLINDTGSLNGVLGVSDDGRYVYYFDAGEIMMWHDGTTRDVGVGSAPQFVDNAISEGQYGNILNQSRVTPDGRHLLFIDNQAPRAGGYDHGVCPSFGCQEMYVYNADTDQVVCASCNPRGTAATVDASVVGDALHGGAVVTSYLNRGITDDGSEVFFSTSEALVPGDTNGRTDAYEYDVDTGKLTLISTGFDSDDSYYVDSSASGRDVFFVTRQRLVGWDRDNAYDLYDARVGGGLPEPPATLPLCSGGTCQGTPAAAPAASQPTSSAFHGAGNVRSHLRKRSPKKACRRGYVKRTVRGKRKCVKRRARHAHAKRSHS